LAAKEYQSGSGDDSGDGEGKGISPQKTQKIIDDREAAKAKAKEEREKELATATSGAELKKSDGGEVEPPRKSKWLESIRKGQAEKEDKAAKEKAERAARYRQFLDSSSDEDEKIDYSNMVGDNLRDYLSKVKNHLQAETNIIDAW